MGKKIFFIAIFIFMIVLSIGAISAADVADADDAIAATDDGPVLEDSGSVSGSVSGGVDVVTENPGKTTGELSYDIPTNAKTIKSADVYVNVYSGSAANTYGADTNITIEAGNAKYIKSEHLWIEQGSTNGTVYPVNENITKCYSDYMIHYNIADKLAGLNGTTLKINVDTFKMEGKEFDGRIKLIALVLAYDDGDDDSISYWVNADQLWTKSNVTINFPTQGKAGLATLTNVVLSSGDGAYKINNNYLVDLIEHKSGSFYYQYNKWGVSTVVDKSRDTSLNVAYAGTSTYGSIKNALSVLTIEDMASSISLTPEYYKTGYMAAYAGTNNTLTINVATTKAGKYVVKLLADGVVVNQTEIDLTAGTNTLLLTDPTIRPVDETTVNGNNNKNVTYTVDLYLNDVIANSSSIELPILYNGNLGKDLAYPAGGMESFFNTIVTGGIEINTKDASTYLATGDLHRDDVWTVNLAGSSDLVKAFVYVPYNWFDLSKGIPEDENMFNVTFNGVKVVPVALYKDQGNLGQYATRGYGLLVYDVTGLFNISGDNTFSINKLNKTPAVYPSTLIYMYNTTGSSTIKEIYISNGADLLACYADNTFRNDANRPVKSDSTIIVNSKLTSNAMLYVFAAGGQAGEGNVVINGDLHENVWSGSDKTTDLYTVDITGKQKDSNSISFVSTSTTILALQQIMVLTKNLDDAAISLVPEYTTSGNYAAYAGTNNAITITIDVVKSGKYTVKLLADGVAVNETNVTFDYGSNKVILIDPTVRPVNETTVIGAPDNKKVNYTVQLLENSVVKNSSSISIPILYNGNLGKDLAYPAGGMESFLNITITGDLVIDAKPASTKLSSGDMNRTDVWNINLDAKSTVAKSYIYVPYNWFNPSKNVKEDVNMFNATFNGVKVVPVAIYRDQGNLGSYGKYSYGLLVYDVTDLTIKGQNTFVLNKLNDTPSVYPSVLMYMYNTAGSAVLRNVYISNGADLLSATTGNVAGRTVKSDSNIAVSNLGDTAKLYVFASNAKTNYGNLVFNGKTYENIWSGADYSSEVFTLDITNSIKNSNDISFVATGSTILALQQIIVTTQKVKTTITAPSVTQVYNNNKNLVVTLKDAKGNAVANAKLTVVLNGAKKVLTTNADGKVTLAIPNLVPKTYAVSITYDGDATHLKSSANAKVIVKKATVKLTAKKKTFKAKVKVKKYTVTLKNNKNKVMKKVKLTLKIKKKTYKATTNKKGKAIFKIKKLTKKGKYTGKITYNGNKYYNKLTKKVKITVKK